MAMSDILSYRGFFTPKLKSGKIPATNSGRGFRQFSPDV